NKHIREASKATSNVGLYCTVNYLVPTRRGLCTTTDPSPIHCMPQWAVVSDTIVYVSVLVTS
ncbi:MAG: hypothetical protein ACKPKO_24970, partial [Candidatus Fonsibacter sp.]